MAECLRPRPSDHLCTTTVRRKLSSWLANDEHFSSNTPTFLKQRIHVIFKLSDGVVLNSAMSYF
jgi:hypothetical protein